MLPNFLPGRSLPYTWLLKSGPAKAGLAGPAPTPLSYLPMHGVYKESSSTTKLRVVFDASAQTSTNTSLNDILSVGPTLHPTPWTRFFSGSGHTG